MPQVHPAQVDCLCDVPGYLYMKEIKLSQGKFALVDDEDFEYLNQWRWNALKSGNIYYASRCVYIRCNNIKSTKTVLMHKELINTDKGFEIDHINRNGLDNRRVNLRKVTHRQNMLNRSDQSKYMGVCKNGNVFRAKVYVNHKQIYIGNYSTPEEAQAAYFNYINKLI